jgi:hypothetical protein
MPFLAPSPCLRGGCAEQQDYKNKLPHDGPRSWKEIRRIGPGSLLGVLAVIKVALLVFEIFAMIQKCCVSSRKYFGQIDTT